MGTENILKYNDFIASVKYSEEDEAFIGRIEGINSVVSFEGQSVNELKSAFKEAVESYLDFCPGYLRQGAKTYDTAAENQLCPVGAIKRKFVEEPYFEYTIDEDLCDGCSKCVKGCYNFGNGSLYLQIMHNLCANCNECRIASNCPSNAISRVSENESYIRKELTSG